MKSDRGLDNNLTHVELKRRILHDVPPCVRLAAVYTKKKHTRLTKGINESGRRATDKQRRGKPTHHLPWRFIIAVSTSPAEGTDIECAKKVKKSEWLMATWKDLLLARPARLAKPAEQTESKRTGCARVEMDDNRSHHRHLISCAL